MTRGRLREQSFFFIPRGDAQAQHQSGVGPDGDGRRESSFFSTSADAPTTTQSDRPATASESHGNTCNSAAALPAIQEGRLGITDSGTHDGSIITTAPPPSDSTTVRRDPTLEAHAAPHVC